jgi:Tetratricopeptide repeat
MSQAPKLKPERRKVSGVQRAVHGGSLEQAPLAFWLIKALERGFSGTMRLCDGGQTHRLVFSDGVPIGIDSPLRVPSLVDPDMVRMTQVNALHGLAATTSVELDASPPDPAPAVEVNPLALIARGLRGVVSRHDPLAALRALEGKTLRLHPEAPIDELELLPFERKIVAALAARECTIEQLLEQRFVHKRALGSTLYILRALRLFAGDEPVRAAARALPSEPTAPGPSAHAVTASAVTPSAAAAPNRSPKEVLHAEVLQLPAVEKRLLEMERETPFEVLEVDVSSGVQAIRAGYAKQLFRYHPDRIPTNASAELRRACSRICVRLQAAVDDLKTEPLRRRHRDVTLAGSSARDRRQAAASAVMLVADAKRSIHRADFAAAEQQLVEAITVGGEVPEKTALLAWCRAHRIPREKGEGIDHRYDEVLRALRSAVRDDPDNATARYFFGQVLLRSRRTEAAMKQLHIVVELQPHNVNAARLLRIDRMRRQQAAKAGVIERVWRSKRS